MRVAEAHRSIHNPGQDKARAVVEGLICHLVERMGVIGQRIGGESPDDGRDGPGHRKGGGRWRGEWAIKRNLGEGALTVIPLFIPFRYWVY